MVQQLWGKGARAANFIETGGRLASIQHMQRALSVLALAAALVRALPSSASADAQGDFKRGDLAAAAKGWTAAIASNPKNTDALLGLARIRLYEDRREEPHDSRKRRAPRTHPPATLPPRFSPK